MEKIIWFVFMLWAAAMVIGIIIALLPVFAFIAGFLLVIGAFALLGRLVLGLF